VDTGEMFALAAGCGVGLGLLVAILGMLSKTEKVPTAAKPIVDGPLVRLGNFIAPATGPHARERRQAIAVGAPIVGAAVWLTTGVPVFGLVTLALIVMLPALVLPDTSRKEQTARLRALDAWIRGVSARMRAGISLDQALSVSVRDIEVIRPQLTRMSAAISAGLPTSLAVLAFAEEMDDGTYDFACQKLIMVSGRSVEGMADALEALAVAVNKRVQTRQEMEVDRAKPMTTARWVTIVGVLMFCLTPLIQPNFLPAYRTVAGQATFFVLVALMLGCLMWARSIGRLEPEPRIFGPRAARSPADLQSVAFGIGAKK
jgi:tight adherence protein B